MRSAIPAELVRGGTGVGGWKEESEDMMGFASRSCLVGEEHRRGIVFPIVKVPAIS